MVEFEDMGPGTRILISIGLSLFLFAIWLALYEVGANEAFGDLGIIVLGGPILLVGFPLFYGLRIAVFRMVSRPIETVRTNEVRAWTYAVFAFISFLILGLSLPWGVVMTSWIVYIELMDATRPKQGT